MNDFTKDELQNLKYCMRQMTIAIDNYDEIYNKLQSMIDNYCDHKNPYTKLGITVCLDCKEIWETKE